MKQVTVLLMLFSGIYLHAAQPLLEAPGLNQRVNIHLVSSPELARDSFQFVYAVYGNLRSRIQCGTVHSRFYLVHSQENGFRLYDTVADKLTKDTVNVKDEFRIEFSKDSSEIYLEMIQFNAREKISEKGLGIAEIPAVSLWKQVNNGLTSSHSHKQNDDQWMIEKGIPTFITVFLAVVCANAINGKCRDQKKTA